MNFLQSVWTAFAFLMFFTGVLFVILKGYDYYLVKKEIWSRRRIGCFTSNKEWSSAVKDRCCKWAADMPQVQVTDNSNFVLLEKFSGKYSGSELQAWQRGGLLTGIAQYLKNRAGGIELDTLLTNIIEDLFDKNHMWRTDPAHIDHAFLAYAVMQLPIYNDCYYKAMLKIVEVIKGHRGYDGTVYYRPQIQNYRLVDTVGMICPFLIRFGSIYKKQEFVELAFLQIEEYVKYGVHPKTNMPAHAYHTGSKMPLGIYGWGRGVGWYALGLIDSYGELHRDCLMKDQIKKYIVLLADAVIKYQRDDGGWGQCFFTDNNVYDSSATAMLVYFLKKAALLNIIKGDVCSLVIEKGINKLKSSTRRDGTVDFSQGDTKGIAVYSTVFREFPFTQGIVLRALNI